MKFNRKLHAVSGRLLPTTRLAFALLLSCLVLLPASADEGTPVPDTPVADEGIPVADVKTPVADATVESDTVRFSFSGVAWRDVIEWIADEAELALHIDAVPSGSFTYSDPSVFTHDAAINRINLFLLPQGYTLVRSGNLLSVINLSDPRSMQQLDAIAPLVMVSDLDQRGAHDVVKCLFPLGSLDAEDAVEELSAIKLMTQPAVLNKTKQLLVTDTVAKLKNVKAILDSFEPSAMDNGTIVQSFSLKHVDAEDVLVVARPHLGLATGEMIGIDVSLSADLQGKYIFATGIEDKVKLIERLVESIDVPDASVTAASSDAFLKAHKVAGGNVDLAYDVLVTLLAGNDARLSKDDTAGTVVAFATPEVQKQIEEAVAKLAADEPDFEVIPLRNVDPYVAIGLVEQMLDLSTFDSDEDEEGPDPPKIDADPDNRRLFVRGTGEQIGQIKKIVEGLDQTRSSEGSNERIRLLSLYGNHAEQSLALAARFWRLPNPVVMFKSANVLNSTNRERTLHSERGGQSDGGVTELVDALESKTPDQFVSVADRGRLLSSPATNINTPAIDCQLTTRGLLIQCEDPKALDQFQDHLEMLAGPGNNVPSEPIVYYLKYTKPDEALRMLAELLDGGEAVDPSSDSLINATVSSAGSLLGSLITNRDGTMTLIAGTATIVADSRLNRLIAQGTTEDIERIESYLRIIEKDSSITAVETYGQSQVIELQNTRATEVEAALRKAFASRLADSGSQGAAAGAGAQGRAEQEARAKEKDAKKGENGKAPQRPASQKARDLEPKMTLAVHEPSNSLIVTAPEQLFQEVKQLAMTIDGRGAQSIRVITPPNSELLGTLLEEVLLGQSDSRRSREAPKPRRDSDDR